MAKYRSIDLFTGIGGIRLGFDNAFGKNIETVFVSEWDEFAQKTYKSNFKDDFDIAGDITVINEKDIPADEPYQMDLFTDYAALEKKKAKEEEEDRKEKSLQKTMLEIQDKFGKNAILKGTNLQKGATTIMRNKQIGGHSSGEQ